MFKINRIKEETQIHITEEKKGLLSTEAEDWIH